MRIRIGLRGSCGILLGMVACSDALTPASAAPPAIQAAAIAFLAQANGDRAPCVRAAVGPSELSGGRITGRLADASAELVAAVRAQGGVSAVRPVSTCPSADPANPTYVVGWPRRTSGGFEVDTERVCGGRCGEGNLLRIKAVGSRWRAVEAETTWMQ